MNFYVYLDFIVNNDEFFRMVLWRNNINDFLYFCEFFIKVFIGCEFEK